MGTEEQAAADAEFASGYEGTRTETPAAPEPVVEEVQAAPEPEAKVEEAPAAADPLKDVLARLDKVQSSHDKLAGNYGRLLQNFEQLQTTLAAAKAATGKVADAPSQTEIARAAEDPAEWSSLKKDYPEWANATEKLLEARVPKFDVEAFEQKIAQEIEGKTAAMQGKIIDAALNTVLPKWREEVKTDAFNTWLASQPDDIQALGASEDVGDAARMLKLYDSFRTAPKAEPTPAPTAAPQPDTSARSKRLAAAVSPKGTGGHAPGKSEADEFLAGYNSAG